MKSNCWIVALLLLTVPTVRGSLADNACGEKPADVIFVMDSSGSILSEDFTRQLQFVAKVIDMFDMSPGMTRVGAMSFSNWAYVDFNLDKHSTNSDAVHAVRTIRQIKGDTNTAAALAHMRDVMLTPVHGARLDAPHIAIVLTDGKSNEPDKTASEARLTQRYGIHVFAIGVGEGADVDELRSIASDPDENYVFQVTDFNALLKIHDIVAVKTCEVTGLPTARPLLVTDPDMSRSFACGDVDMADVVFAVSPAASAGNTDKALAFYQDVASGLDIAEDKVRVGMVPKDSDVVVQPESRQDSNDQALAVLKKMEARHPSTADVLKYMHRRSFSRKYGSRDGAKKVAVLMADDKDENLRKAYREADRLRGKKGVEILVIGVGKDVEPSTLSRLTGDGTGRMVFHVESYDELERITYAVRDNICPGV